MKFRSVLETAMKLFLNRSWVILGAWIAMQAVLAADVIGSTAKPEIIQGLQTARLAHSRQCPPESCFDPGYPKDRERPRGPFVLDKTFLTPAGRSVHVAVQERLCQPNECSEVDASMWGMDGGVPKFVTTRFEVAIDGVPISIPRKFYVDLTYIHRISISEDSGRVVLGVSGGGAAGYFYARFILGGACGFERQVCGETCDDIWERSTWRNSFIYEKLPQCVGTIQ
jgi:hypothetical protein